MKRINRTASTNKLLRRKIKYFLPGESSSGAMKDKMRPKNIPVRENNGRNISAMFHHPCLWCILSTVFGTLLGFSRGILHSFQFMFKIIQETVPILFLDHRAAGIRMPASSSFYSLQCCSQRSKDGNLGPQAAFHLS